MKLKIFMLLFVAMITLNVAAQNNQNQPQREFPSKELVTQLSLTKDQISTLKEIDSKYMKSLSGLRGQSDRSKMMETMKQARTERLADIKKVLNAEQYVSFLEYEVINPMSGFGGGNRQGGQGGQRNRDNGGGGGGGNFGGGGGGFDD